jgi:hypothetical protein
VLKENEQDNVVWALEKNGTFTTKSLYSYGVFDLWSHPMLHEVMHHEFIP